MMLRRHLGLGVRVVNGTGLGTGRIYLSTREQRQKEILADQEVLFPAEHGLVRNSPYENISIPNLTLDQYVWNNFREWETKIATVRKSYLRSAYNCTFV